MKVTYLWILSIAWAMAGAAHAKVWGDFIAGGTSCNSSNVNIIDMGDNLAVLFDEFGVNMPQNSSEGGMSARKTCTFRIGLTPPKGFYLAGFRQVYSGGLIKSRNSSAQLNITYNIGSVRGSPLPIVWNEGREIRPEDEASLFSRTYENRLLVASCGGSTTYGINMSLSATRRSTSRDFIVGGLDSIDAEFVQQIELIPQWVLCGRSSVR